MNEIRRAAVFSEDRLHRLALSRTWDPRKGFVLFVGLNPSKAGAEFDDMTVRKGIGFARRWGYGGTMHANALTRISTDPKWLAECVDPVRPEAWPFLLEMAQKAAVIVFAWGAFPMHRKAFERVERELAGRAAKCLGKTADGFPRHISRLAYSSELVDY